MGAALAVTSTTGASALRLFVRVEDVEERARSAIGDEAVEKALGDGLKHDRRRGGHDAETLTD